MVDDELEVLGHLDIEFTSPVTIVLGSLESCDGIPGATAFFTVPVASVGSDCKFLGVCTDRCQRNERRYGKKSFESSHVVSLFGLILISQI